ncbi:hypothetical protein J6590_041320 [Homalodisca vitripennis]|nr:hypothetical protein J6590_041320 [Homalodisca vitripennis]
MSWVRRLSQDNQIKQRRAWLLLGQVTAERSCPCKRPACPAIGGGSEVTFKPLVPRLSVREGFLALTSPEGQTTNCRRSRPRTGLGATLSLQTDIGKTARPYFVEHMLGCVIEISITGVGRLCARSVAIHSTSIPSLSLALTVPGRYYQTRCFKLSIKLPTDEGLRRLHYAKVLQRLSASRHSKWGRVFLAVGRVSHRAGPTPFAGLFRSTALL